MKPINKRRISVIDLSAVCKAILLNTHYLVSASVPHHGMVQQDGELAWSLSSDMHMYTDSTVRQLY